MRRDEMATYELRLLRQVPGPGEQALWSRLRGRAFRGLKFRRQDMIAGHIAAFSCRELRLAIEILPSPLPSCDDLSRRAAFKAAGYRCLLLSEAEILADIQATMIRIFRETRI